MSYAAVSDILDRMGQPSTTGGTLFQTVTDALPATKEWIDLDTDRTFTASTSTRTFNTSGTDELSLPDFTAITALRLDDDDDGTFEVTVPDTAYELHKSATDRPDWPYDTIRLLDRCFPWTGRRRIRVEIEGTWGWAAVPAGIGQAQTLLVVRLVQRPQAPFGVISFGDVASASIRNSDPDYVNLITPYKRTGFA